MAYVISACADQGEEINSRLPPNAINNPYHLSDVLPGMEMGLNTLGYLDRYADGSRSKLHQLIASESEVIGPIEEVVWGNKQSVFGPKVCFINISKTCTRI
jgi:hypothetical protein